MVRHTSQIVVIAALGLLGSTLWGTTGSAQTARSALPSLVASTIQGVVVDEDGQPLASVRVRVLGPTTVAGTTNAQGAFRISSLPSGQYLVRAYAAGYLAAMSDRITLSARAAPSLRLTLVRDGVAERAAPTELAAGFGLAAAGDGAVPGEEQPDVVSIDVSDEGDSETGEPELTWRLRRLKRSPLKAVDTARLDLPDGHPDANRERVYAASMRTASSLFDESLTGEVNLLTSGAFDSPQQLFSSNRFARNVTYASVGAAAGDVGTWTVRGAMTQGDVSSWVVAGLLAAPEGSRHAYEVGMSYSTQRYDGGNAEALAAVSDGARNATDIYAFDRWKVTPKLSLGYGARYSHYEYVNDEGWLSPRVGVILSPVDRLRVHVLAARRMVAPGAEEFVPTISTGLWLPPERTFSVLDTANGFRVERNDHYEVGIEHDLDSTVVIAFRAFEQNVNDQLATLFHVRPATAGASELGHYYVATAGDVYTRGWAASVSHEVGTVRSTIEYSQARALWEPDGAAGAIARVAPSVVRRGAEDLAEITTSVRAAIPRTATRLYVLYRVSNGFARVEDVRTGARFNVQINQGLPFMNFNGAEWEMLVDVRNFFRDSSADMSLYDELLVVNPPKRIVGGLLVRF